MPEILVLYYSPGGTIAEMANIVAHGVESVDGMQARVRTVPKVSANNEQSENTVPEQGPMYATIDDLDECSGIIVGCPTHFGNMPAPMATITSRTSTGTTTRGIKIRSSPVAVSAGRMYIPTIGLR